MSTTTSDTQATPPQYPDLLTIDHLIDVAVRQGIRPDPGVYINQDPDGTIVACAVGLAIIASAEASARAAGEALDVTTVFTVDTDYPALMRHRRRLTEQTGVPELFINEMEDGFSTAHFEHFQSSREWRRFGCDLYHQWVARMGEGNPS